MNCLDNLNPKNVFKYFGEISSIPRGSGNEKAISDYLVNFAKERNLEVIQDKAFNVIIKKKTSAGYENVPTVIIQGHMDMVCEKTKESKHNFEKDPLKLRVVDNMLYASDTTLGADNGIAVAYALALLDDNSINHPNLEVLMTSEEETGMGGATALDASNLNGNYLLNIDSEVEGELLVSCAGGIRAKMGIALSYKTPTKQNAYTIHIKNLKGGHSGLEIIKQRANAIKLMGRLLNRICEDVDFEIAFIDGGAKMNAIPRESESIILIDDVSKVESIVKECEAIFKNEYKVADPDLTITFEKSSQSFDKAFSDTTKQKLISTLILIPDGVQSFSKDIEGLVQSSTNVGVLSIVGDEISLDNAVRSSVKSLKYEIADKMKVLAISIGNTISFESDYPEWEFNPDSKLKDILSKVYKDINGKEPLINAIHAGLECGLLKEKLPNTDMISFGPNLYDVHTPLEHVEIASVERVWNFLIKTLESIK